jgi:hypothetical protein
VTVDASRLRKLAMVRKVELTLDPSWINPEMEQLWVRHRRRYKDLPDGLELLISQVNQWLLGLKS